MSDNNHTPAAPATTSSLAVISCLLGILALATGVTTLLTRFYPLLLVMLVCALVAVILGAVACWRFKAYPLMRGRTFAGSGILLGCVGILPGFLLPFA